VALAKNIVVFNANGDELWVTDGTAAGTFELTGPDTASAGYAPLPILNGEVLFAGVNGSGQKGLWVTDGTVAGTHEVTGIAGIPSSGLNMDEGAVVLNGKVLFSSINPDENNFDLWVTDGTGPGTYEIAAGVEASDLTVYNDEVLFHGLGNDLWVTEGTAAGTHALVTSVTSPYGSVSGNAVEPEDLTPFNGEVYFGGVSQLGYPIYLHYNDLWVTDGTEAGTHAVTNIYNVTGEGPYGLGPQDLTVFNNELLFSGSDANQQVGLWVSDGTAAGTHELTGISGFSPRFGLYPSNMTVFNDKVLFQGSDPNYTWGLWVTDGTAAGTHELTGISGASISGMGLEPTGLTVVGDKVLFEGYNSDGQNALWETDGTAAGTHEISEIGAYVPYNAQMAVLQVACYCRGTRILTAGGEVAVEDLEIGDRVETSSGALRPIKWIGRRSYGGRFIMGRKEMLPICFKAGSLGAGLPRRELWISPHHAMFIDGVLIEAKDLVNGVSIVQANGGVEQVEYFHIELDSHDVIVAEGAWSETFIDDDSRAMFHNAPEYAALYPGQSAPAARYCAPRLDQGFELEAIRQKIAERSGAAGARLSKVGALRGLGSAA
jgi:ELWxxDGT repeat protein